MARASLARVRGLVEERGALLRDIRAEQQRVARELEVMRRRRCRRGGRQTFSGAPSPARPGRACPRMRVADISAFLQ